MGAVVFLYPSFHEKGFDFFVATGVLLITAHTDCRRFQMGARV